MVAKLAGSLTVYLAPGMDPFNLTSNSITTTSESSVTWTATRGSIIGSNNNTTVNTQWHSLPGLLTCNIINAEGTQHLQVKLLQVSVYVIV